jgi:hypothetical protein
MEKTKQLHVLPKLVKCHFAATSFDLWMFKGTYDVCISYYFLGNDWQPKHVTIGLFKATKTT